MMEFNEDGSLKLPDRMQKKNDANEHKFKTQKCIKIRREVINYGAPKKCALKITLSENITDNTFIHKIHEYFKSQAQVPTKIEKINDKQFCIEIGTDLRRCTDCNRLVNRYREYLERNVIEEKGECTFENKIKKFSYDDYFS